MSIFSPPMPFIPSPTLRSDLADGRMQMEASLGKRYRVAIIWKRCEGGKAGIIMGLRVQRYDLIWKEYRFKVLDKDDTAEGKVSKAVSSLIDAVRSNKYH